MKRIQRLLLVWPTCLTLLVGCASPGGQREGEAWLVTLHNFKGGERFELASEAHTDRVAYYSDERADAARKIQTDEVMSAFVRELERRGFTRHAQEGPGPSTAGEVVRWGLAIQAKDGNSQHWLVGTGSAPDDWKAFQECRDAFLQLYNSTVSFQVVENPKGREFFDDEARSATSRPRSR